ncbi:CCL1 protein, partial [Dromaius novaehollandiae]|nr:C-C motif chemokine 7-like [Dromaius novaehollandiae]NXG31063.1 CCL1 protein [Dromaius novaehollandiae]
MKLFSSALVSLLLAALWAETQGRSFRSPYTTCCYPEMFIQDAIPAFFIKSYRQTLPNCTRKAVLVELQRGKKVCVDPKAAWFQKYLQRKNQTSSRL